MEKRVLLHNSIKTPDGTILVSKHVHDYVSHKDKVTNTVFAVDGGDEYQRWLIGGKYEDLSLYSDDQHEKLREVVERGRRGIHGDEELKYEVLKDISDGWLQAIIIYEEKLRPDNKYLPVYRTEEEYRKTNNINVK